MADYVPDRGHLVWVTFDPQVGREQAGKRPAVVLSPANYNGKVGLAIFCPITNQKKGYPFEVVLSGNNKTTGVILSDQVKSFDWRARQATYIETLDSDTLMQVMQKLNRLIG